MELNQVGSTGLIQNTQLEQTSAIGQTSKNNKVKNNESSFDSLSLDLSNANKSSRSTYANKLGEINDAFAISQIAINALDKQQNILNDIQKNMQINTQESAKATQQLLVQFNEIADNTKYKNQSLLQNTYDNKQISASLGENSIQFNVPNTPQIVNDIISTVNNGGDLNQTLNNAQEQLQSYKSQFSELASSAIDASNSVQIKENEQQSTAKALNFGKESNDFNKTNLVAQMGYLLASQANTNQEMSIKLLAM